MLKSYWKAALRNLTKNKAHSFINIAGLSAGIAVALLIGLWIWDEWSFDRYNPNYDRVAQVMLNHSRDGKINTSLAGPVPMGPELRKNYGNDFRHVVMSSWIGNHILAAGDKKITGSGSYMDAGAPDMLSLKILEGSGAGLEDPHSVLLSRSIAKALFGEGDPIGQTVLMDNTAALKVIGLYEDLPHNTSFTHLSFIAPWNLYVTTVEPVKNFTARWDMNGVQTFVQLADNTNISRVSEKIGNTVYNKDKTSKVKTTVFLQPMSRWHLYSEFKNGVNTGGSIQYIRLFATIGIFVLLLACINFMNLSTARSEKRAKEVGIRKAIGSLRGQLISQFFTESILMALLAFVFALLLAQGGLSFFNQVAGKKMLIPWGQPLFWLLGLGFALLTGLIAGCYPALYLSSFQPVKVLKGTFKAGRFAAIPRKVLVVLQFTVSMSLIIGTIVVFRQIQFAKDRPIGYDRNGLLTIGMLTPDLHDHFDAMRNDLLQKGAIAEMAESTSPLTAVWNTFGNFKWKGKDPAMADEIATVGITTGYGKTVGWQFKEGRDFSAQFGTDSSRLILNEAAVRYMGLKDPVGETISWSRRDWKVIGVIPDMVMESPYEPVKQTVFYLNPAAGSFIDIRINPTISAREGISKIEKACKTYSPSIPFSYQFVDEAYAKKFSTEERISQLAAFFALLAILISSLGLFGMASFMAEQRIKEIGVRKVLGASVFNLWGLLSRDFVVLVVVAVLIAAPAAYAFMHGWLQNYQYRTEIPWWIFAVAGVGALIVTLATVSFQAIRAALMNPTRSLRTE
ncbi:MAG TPA: ABC transporter permease [Puia sp.]|nr:ABC transporter permease [Puia sp.]